LQKTAIEWVLNQGGTPGFTSNPVRGECPVDYSYCYVKPFRARYGWHKDIRFYPEELNKIVCRKKPAGIFLGSTIELFHDKTIQYMPCIMDCIKASPQHRFYLLTKCPQNLPREFPDNCWVGVSVTDDKMMVRAIKELRRARATVKFISFEPLLEHVNIHWVDIYLKDAGVNWLIIGQQTPIRPETTPKIAWVEEIVEAADKASIPVFLKNNLRSDFYPILRQEMPLDRT